MEEIETEEEFLKTKVGDSHFWKVKSGKWIEIISFIATCKKINYDENYRKIYTFNTRVIEGRNVLPKLTLSSPNLASWHIYSITEEERKNPDKILFAFKL